MAASRLSGAFLTGFSVSTPIQSIASLGLNPSYSDISSFVAAAGFAEAAAFHNLSDPPFIQKSWAVAQFKVCQFRYLIDWHKHLNG